MSTSCAVALVLLLDASTSIQADDWQAMVEGHADAIQSAGVASVIERGDGVAVAARAFANGTARLFGWQMIRTREDAARVARLFSGIERPESIGGFTSLGAAIRDGAADLATAPACDEQVIDIVTDGRETSGPTAHDERPAVEALGYRINGVMVGAHADADWMRANVISQPGTAARAGFVRHAADWSEFADAIRTKITLEIASR